MQKEIPHHPDSCRVFEALETSMQASMDKVRRAQHEAGLEIRGQTRMALFKIGKDVLPRFIDVLDETPDMQQDQTRRSIVQYDTQENILVLVKRNKYQQVVGVGTRIEDAEWTKYRHPLVRALETAVHTALQAKRQ